VIWSGEDSRLHLDWKSLKSTPRRRSGTSATYWARVLGAVIFETAGLIQWKD